MIYKRWWKFIVLRGDGIPASQDGMWYDVDSLTNLSGIKPLEYGGATFQPTNRWEQREDGEVAVVYEWVR